MTPFNCTLDVLSGFGAGHQYFAMKASEDEIKQGKNYYNASLYQVGQWGAFTTIISRIATNTLSGTSNLIVQIASEVLPILLIPVNLLIASIKQKNYEDFAHSWNQSDKTYCHCMPENLSETTKKIANFLVEHTGDMIRVAMIAGVVALIVLGDIAFSVSALLPLIYQIMIEQGWVPDAVIGFLETYLPLISIIGTLIGGTLILRIVALLMLPDYLMPSLNQYLLQQMDHLYRYFFPSYGPTLEEINGELVVNKELTFDEINQILDAGVHEYEINPAHGPKPAFDLSVLPQDDDFDHMMTLFDEIDWMEYYERIKKRLADDEIFIDMLAKKFPEVSKREEFEEHIEDFIEKLAVEKNVSEARFAVNWVREQLGYFIAVLKRERPVQGSQSNLAEATEDSKRIVAHLKALKQKNKQVELEDTLLKIAIEQGDYCALGFKRAGKELCASVIDAFLNPTEDEESGDAVKDHELTIRMMLEDIRRRRVEVCYQKGVELFSKLDLEGLAADVHNFEFFRTIFTFGFTPMTGNEKRKFGFLNLLIWNQSLPSALRAQFYEKTFLGRVPYPDAEAGKVKGKMFDYVRAMIKANPKLSQKDKDALDDKLATWNNYKWSGQATEEKFFRLLYVMLGVLRKKVEKPRPEPVFFSDYPKALDVLLQYAPKKQ